MKHIKRLDEMAGNNIQPKTKDELKRLIDERIKEQGPECDLNDLDVSRITDMSDLFSESDFNGDISEWNVGNVEDMSFMFANSKFNGDISKWNVSKVKYMDYMFSESDFNGDISAWDVRNVKNMNNMFYFSPFNGDISKWDVSNVRSMYGMFDDSPLEKNPPRWYKETNESLDTHRNGKRMPKRVNEAWDMAAELGYEPKTTFWDDFTIADRFGASAVNDTYKRAFNEWKGDHIYLTELVMVLNHKIWEHFHKHNEALAKLYNDLWEKTNDYALDNLKGKELDYFYSVTD